MKGTKIQQGKPLIAGVLIVLMCAPLAPTAAAQQESQAQSQQALLPEAPSPQLAEPPGGGSQAQSSQQQNTNPVGTAAAPVAKPTGVAASRPAGAVIAPAKQKRRKAILIRVGIIVGAGVAVGTVAALSPGSSGRP